MAFKKFGVPVAQEHTFELEEKEETSKKLKEKDEKDEKEK